MHSSHHTPLSIHFHFHLQCTPDFFPSSLLNTQLILPIMRPLGRMELKLVFDGMELECDGMLNLLIIMMNKIW